MGKTRLHFRGRTPLVAAQKISINAPKSRASRDSATDPQSLYARVDVSTMLEEAVQYVKFLQLQIKLLSSDDLRMYSPIAYNGMDIGLDLKMGTTKS
ncbi:transcription factor bHLH84-like isoform X2 [Capsicum annuum]|uniref:transcription factor bHLH84-like isoform X2 n=1 Tax=Capsicum annuum TaxID=4072 RepID=UPI001FB106F5|nr:transcription factor bHLH84-like isoform X2 [Capsicum annuum]